MNFTFKEVIVTHVNYRDVFNAPLLIDSLILWTGLKNDEIGRESLNVILTELVEEKLIVIKNDYVAVYGKEHIIDSQKEKNELTERLIHRGKGTLKWFTRIPFVRYLGISGSVAANNPTSSSKDLVDLDLFVITSKNTLWLIFLIERLITNLIRFLKGDHYYCFNYVTEEDFLSISNKNFYTATELVNLKTVYDKGVYAKFIEANEWHTNYYSKESIQTNNYKHEKSPIYFNLLSPLNYLFYVIFSFFRGLKRLNLKIALEFTSKYNPNQRCNLSRISNPAGGYQDSIKKRFSELFQKNFNKYYSEELLESLFTKEDKNDSGDSYVNTKKEFTQFFTKYSLNGNEKSTV